VSGTAVGSLLAGAGLIPLLALDDRRLRQAGFALWTAGVLVLAGDILHSPISRMRVEAQDRPALALVGLVAGAALLVAGGALAHRRPELVLLAAILAAPARIPVSAGGEEANLLLPLYAVIAAAWAAMAWELLRGIEQPPQLGRLGQASAALIGWAAVATIWTVDDRKGGIEMLFFLLPFGLLLARLGALRPRLRELRLGLGIQVALALVFVAVAAYQYIARDVFWNETIKVNNEYASFFRVNSLFFDASVYGRFLAVTIVLLAGVAVFRRVTWPLLGLMAVLLAGLVVSYSQSAMLGLATGALVLGFAVWPRRLMIGMTAGGVAIGLAALVVALTGNSTESVTSDRSRLIELGGDVIREHPLLGAGTGGFARAALEGFDQPWKVDTANSHTTPVTVQAEWGPVGMALYLWFLAAPAMLVWRRRREPYPQLVALAGVAVILASSVFYNAFFEDPALWILLALIATMSPIPDPRPKAAA
jgi:O-antigen ligase